MEVKMEMGMYCDRPERDIEVGDLRWVKMRVLAGRKIERRMLKDFSFLGWWIVWCDSLNFRYLNSVLLDCYNNYIFIHTSKLSRPIATCIFSLFYRANLTTFPTQFLHPQYLDIRHICTKIPRLMHIYMRCISYSPTPNNIFSVPVTPEFSDHNFLFLDSQARPSVSTSLRPEARIVIRETGLGVLLMCRAQARCVGPRTSARVRGTDEEIDVQRMTRDEWIIDEWLIRERKFDKERKNVIEIPSYLVIRYGWKYLVFIMLVTSYS